MTTDSVFKWKKQLFPPGYRLRFESRIPSTSAQMRDAARYIFEHFLLADAHPPDMLVNMKGEGTESFQPLFSVRGTWTDSLESDEDEPKIIPWSFDAGTEFERSEIGGSIYYRIRNQKNFSHLPVHSLQGVLELADCVVTQFAFHIECFHPRLFSSFLPLAPVVRDWLILKGGSLIDGRSELYLQTTSEGLASKDSFPLQSSTAQNIVVQMYSTVFRRDILAECGDAAQNASPFSDG